MKFGMFRFLFDCQGDSSLIRIHYYHGSHFMCSDPGAFFTSDIILSSVVPVISFEETKALAQRSLLPFFLKSRNIIFAVQKAFLKCTICSTLPGSHALSWVSENNHSLCLFHNQGTDV